MNNNKHRGGEMAFKSLVHYPYSYWLNLKYQAGVLFGLEKPEPVKNDGYPLPPVPLRYRVHGAPDISSFVTVGRRCANDLQTILEENSLSWSEFHQILDFGCGCGRVLRYLPACPDKERGLSGTDIDRKAINWCRENLPFASWHHNGSLPPTRYAESHFDFVFAISVFTHLDESYQNAWLSEIHRIMKPEGVLLATIHGEQFARMLGKGLGEALPNAGILNKATFTGALKLDGLPDFYQTTYHSRRYIEKAWGSLFEIIEYREKGMNRLQDAVLMRKRSQVKP
jgi:SAM-dependent methyltransferase